MPADSVTAEQPDLPPLTACGGLVAPYRAMDPDAIIEAYETRFGLPPVRLEHNLTMLAMLDELAAELARCLERGQPVADWDELEDRLYRQM